MFSATERSGIVAGARGRVRRAISVEQGVEVGALERAVAVVGGLFGHEREVDRAARHQ